MITALLKQPQNEDIAFMEPPTDAPLTDEDAKTYVESISKTFPKKKKKFDYLIFIGRFQPLHNGHAHIIKEALKLANQVIILIGSSNLARSFLRNPFIYEEVHQMLFEEFDGKPIIINPLDDYIYNNVLWILKVQKKIKYIIKEHGKTMYNMAKIGIIGHDKDPTSFYLKSFPQWELILLNSHKNINGSSIRGPYFYTEPEPFKNFVSSLVPNSSINFLMEFRKTDEYRNIKEEYNFVQHYKGEFKDKFKPIFQTVDAVVIQSGHVLMVERKSHPGKSLYALPGGFLNPEEKLIDAMIRELREETRLKIPIPVLKGSIKEERTYDYPYRSVRGRTITKAYLIQLKDEESLPKVRGSDDAKRAFWMPLGELEPRQIFEDHFFIIRNLIGML